MDKLLVTAKTERAARALSRLRQDTDKANTRIRRLGFKPQMLVIPTRDMPAEVVIEIAALKALKDAFDTYEIDRETELEINIL